MRYLLDDFSARVVVLVDSIAEAIEGSLLEFDLHQEATDSIFASD
jgi:hypothetical protein